MHATYKHASPEPHPPPGAATTLSRNNNGITFEIMTHSHATLLLLSRAAFDHINSFTTSHFRRHSTPPYPSAFVFQRCFRPLYCFSPHCFFGDTARHHSLLLLLSRTAFDRTIPFHRIAFSETQNITIPIRYCLLASTAFDRVVSIALHFPTETQNVVHTSTLRYPILLFCFCSRCFLLHWFYACFLFWLYP